AQRPSRRPQPLRRGRKYRRSQLSLATRFFPFILAPCSTAGFSFVGQFSQQNQKSESSRPTEPPRQPLTEPYVTLSRHTALVIPIISNVSPVRKQGRPPLFYLR